MFLIISGCSGNHSHWVKTVERDGVLYVMNRIGDYQKEEPIERLSAVRELKIRSDSVNPDTLFARITQLGWDRLGNLYIFDSWDDRVVKITSDGDLVTIFGGRGEGPGELSGCSSFVVIGDRIYFTNSEFGRIEVFDLQGRYLHSLNPDGCTKPIYIFSRRGDFFIAQRRFYTEVCALLKYSRQFLFLGCLYHGREIKNGWDILRAYHRWIPSSQGIWIIHVMTNEIEWIDFAGNRRFVSIILDHPGTQKRDAQGKTLPLHLIQAVAASDQEGNLYVGYRFPDNWRARHRIYKFNREGVLLGKAFELPEEEMDILTFGPDGLFYFTNGVKIYVAEIVAN